MWSRSLADLVILSHFAYLAFVALGGFAVLRWPRLAWLHLPAVAWGIIVEYTGWICPLTPLEVALEARGGEPGYTGGFIDHYIAGLIYPEGLTRRDQFVLGSAALAMNAAIYAALIARIRARRRAARPGDAGPAPGEGR